jgi:hypothetical protein
VFALSLSDFCQQFGPWLSTEVDAFVRNGSSHPAESQQPPGEVTETILPVVSEQGRVQEGRDPEPSAGLFDSQSVRGADTVGRDTRGDATSPAQAWSMPM